MPPLPFIPLMPPMPPLPFIPPAGALPPPFPISQPPPPPQLPLPPLSLPPHSPQPPQEFIIMFIAFIIPFIGPPFPPRESRGVAKTTVTGLVRFCGTLPFTFSTIHLASSTVCMITKAAAAFFPAATGNTVTCFTEPY
eukprot:Skav214335  [mRNA]  locus=scaffold86:347226:348273:- [translate_table: standard]